MFRGVFVTGPPRRLARAVAALVLTGTALAAGPAGPADAAPATAVDYVTTVGWGIGFQVQLSLRPAVTLTGWQVEFDLPDDQQLSNAFYAGATQTGRHVVLTNRPFNGTVTAGSTLNVGLQVASASLSNASPAQITVNGQPALYTEQGRILLAQHRPSVLEGSSTAVTATLSTRPAGPIRIQVGSSPAAAVVASPQYLTFDAGDWNVPHPVTLSSPEDADSVGQLVWVPLQQSTGPTHYASDWLQATQLDND